MNDKLRACAHESFRLGSEYGIVQVGRLGPRVVLHGNLRTILDRCRTFADMDTHAAEIGRHFKLPPDQWGTIKVALADLRERGLLISESDLVIARGDRRHKSPTRITTVAIITCDRPVALMECLQSYAHIYSVMDRPTEMIVMDDSTADQSRSQNRTALASGCVLARTRYADRSARETFIKELAACGISSDVLRFGLLDGAVGVCGPKMGANRNSVLVDTVGQKIFMADDDTLCLTSSHPERVDGLDFVSHEEARDMHFFRSREDVRERYTWVGGDILSEHEQLLGRAIDDLAAQSGPGGCSFDRGCDHLLAALSEGEGDVLITMSGIGGDSGGYSGQWMLSSRGKTQHRLWSDQAVFNTAFNSREVFGAARRATVSHHLACHSTTLGLANDLCLPPFLPQFANEDGVFGAIAGFGAPRSFFGHVPVAVFHNAAKGRRYVKKANFRVSDMVIALMVFSGPQPLGGMATALRNIGRRLVEVAELPPNEFWQVATERATLLKAEQLRQMESAVKSGGSCPEYFASAVREHIQETCSNLSDPKYFVPYEFSSQLPPEDARTMAQVFILSFGRLLLAWPDVLDAARDLAARGIRISKEL